MTLYSNYVILITLVGSFSTSETQYGLQLYSDGKHYRINSFTVILLHEAWGSLHRFDFKY